VQASNNNNLTAAGGVKTALSPANPALVAAHSRRRSPLIVRDGMRLRTICELIPVNATFCGVMHWPSGKRPPLELWNLCETVSPVLVKHSTLSGQTLFANGLIPVPGLA